MMASRIRQEDHPNFSCHLYKRNFITIQINIIINTLNNRKKRPFPINLQINFTSRVINDHLAVKNMSRNRPLRSWMDCGFRVIR
jgi:hypothetical protein